MKRSFLTFSTLLSLMLILSGCNTVGDKATSMSIIYAITTVLSLLMLISYCASIKKRSIWFILLFSSISVVNIGYFALSVASTLDFALHANRLSYLGSVFLPLSMFMIILNVTKLKHGKWLPIILLSVSVIVFLIAASPGYLDIYYKAVTLEIINGVSVLNKTYGPWHSIYLFYLLGYFILMISAIVHAIIKKKLESTVHAVILASAVLVNIGVWLLEQMVNINFEFLSVSYIISGFFLIGLYLMIENQEKLINSMSHTNKQSSTSLNSKDLSSHCRFLSEHLYLLTATEREIYNRYVAGEGTKQVMSALNITENTLKYHNKNIYSKLGVSSRKQLIECAKANETKKEGN